MTNQTSEHLATRYKTTKDSRAFTILYRRHRTHVKAMAMRYLHPSEVEEMVQDVFVRVVEKIDWYDEVSCFAVWLHVMARNHIFNCVKIANRKRTVATCTSTERDLCDREVSKITCAAKSGDFIDPAMTVADREAADKLALAMNTLTPTEKSVVDAVQIGGVLYAARILKMAHSYVSVVNKRALRILASRLRMLGIDGSNDYKTVAGITLLQRRPGLLYR